MKLDKLNSVIKEELRKVLGERVGSKILKARKLDKRLKNYLSRKYGIEVDGELIIKSKYK